MKFTFSLLVTSALALTARAESNVQTILDQLSIVGNLTDRTTSIISEVNDTLQSVLPVNSATTVLVSQIQNSTMLVKPFPVLSESDALKLGGPTQLLAYKVNGSITELIRKKPDFQKLGIASIVVTTLTTQLSASNNLSDLIVSKVPTELKATSDAISSQISDSIQMGIDCFGKNESCFVSTATIGSTTFPTTTSVPDGENAVNAAVRTAGAVGYGAVAVAAVLGLFAMV